MTQQEKKISQVEARVSNLETKFELYMKRQDELALDIRELRQDMKDMQNRLDAKIDGISKHVQNLTVTAMVGVGTSVIAVVVLVGTTIYALLSR